MTFTHGKSAYLSVDGTDISAYTNNVVYTRNADSHDVTTFGKSAHVYVAGLTDGTLTAEGIYDNTATTGPHDKFVTLMAAGAAFTVKWRPEGTGAGKPEAESSCILTSYEETAPVADMVTWSAEFQLSDTIDNTDQ